MEGLKKSIEKKFKIPAERIGQVLKRCHKNVTLEVDDGIVRHYSDEDTFVINISQQNNNEPINVVLTEIP